MNEDEKEMYDKLRRTQDFRDIMLEFVSETRTNNKNAEQRWNRMDTRLCGIESRLTTGEACVAGARHAERLAGHDREIRDLKRPTRRAAVVTGGAVGGAGIIVLLFQWLVENWNKIFGG